MASIKYLICPIDGSHRRQALKPEGSTRLTHTVSTSVEGETTITEVTINPGEILVATIKSKGDEVQVDFTIRDGNVAEKGMDPKE